MKKFQPILYLILCTLFACTEETLIITPPDPSDPFEEGLEKVTLHLKSLPINIIGEEWAAASDTRVAEGIDDKLISNIWVFQYDASGNQITAPHYYTLPANVQNSANINVMLRPATNSQIYVIANTNSNTWLNGADVSTLNKLKTKTHTFNTENEVYGGTNKNLMMSGSISNATIKAGKSNALSDIQLKRMVAMITFQYKFATADLATKLKVTGIELTSVPNTLQIGDPTGNYPASVTPLAYSQISSPVANTFYTGYVPENLQGTITNTDEKNKNQGAPTNAIAIRLYIDSEMDGSKYVYTVYPGENNTNDFNIKRNYKYTLTLNLQSSSTDSRVMAAPANCFVMKRNASIVFDPYDRTETGGGWKYTDYVDKTNPNKSFDRVDILWQTGDGTNFAIGNNSAGGLVYYDNVTKKVYVKSGKIDGNAVIAGYCHGVILWSWHIWVNDSSPAQVANAVKYKTYKWDATQIYTAQARIDGFSFMACNLGAENNIPGDPRSAGLFYQWGRKDPFPQAKSYNYNGLRAYTYDGDIINTYNNSASLIPMTTTAGTNTGEVFKAEPTSALVGTIEYAIANPTTFITGSVKAGGFITTPGNESGMNNQSNYYNNGNWFWADGDFTNNDKMWGGTPYQTASTKLIVNGKEILANNGAKHKSLFDPCPSGWMLPASDAWMGFTATGLNIPDGGWASLNTVEQQSANCKNGLTFYMQAWRSGDTSYFPTQGFRLADGSIIRSLGCGGYFTSAASPGGNVYILHIHYGFVYPYDLDSYPYNRRACGMALRCVRETK